MEPGERRLRPGRRSAKSPCSAGRKRAGAGGIKYRLKNKKPRISEAKRKERNRIFRKGRFSGNGSTWRSTWNKLPRKVPKNKKRARIGPERGKEREKFPCRETFIFYREGNRLVSCRQLPERAVGMNAPGAKKCRIGPGRCAELIGRGTVKKGVKKDRNAPLP